WFPLLAAGNQAGTSHAAAAGHDGDRDGGSGGQRGTAGEGDGMRIALICMQPDPFAAARGRRRQVAELARAIARAGHEVRVYALGEKAGESTSAFTPEGVTVEYGPAAPPDRHG